jgi:hypothetical protein
MGTYVLENCVEMNRKFPETFEIPPREELEKLKPTDLAYLIFKDEQGRGERMWVEIESIDGDTLQGKLADMPALLTEILKQGDKIKFDFSNIADFVTAEEDEKIKEEIRKTGKIDGGAVSFSEVGKVLENLGKAMTNQEENNDLLGELAYIREETERSKNDPAKTLSLQMTFYKFFCFVAISLISVRVVAGSDKVRVSAELAKGLREAEKVLYEIGETHLPVLMEYMDQYGPSGMEKIPDHELPAFFGSIIQEAYEKVEKNLVV